SSRGGAICLSPSDARWQRRSGGATRQSCSLSRGFWSSSSSSPSCGESSSLTSCRRPRRSPCSWAASWRNCGPYHQIRCRGAVAGHEIGTLRSLRDLALEAGIADRPWSRIIAYKLSRPSLVFYGERDVTIVAAPADLRSVLDPESLVVLEERRFEELGADWQN